MLCLNLDEGIVDSELCHSFHGRSLFSVVIYCIQGSLLTFCCQTCSLANPLMKWDHTSETSDIKRMSPRNYAHRKQENENPSSLKFIIFSWHQNHIVNQRIIWHPLIARLLYLLKKHVHNNSIIIRSSVSKERYEHIHPDPKIICICSEGLFPPLSLPWKFRARFQNITVFWMRGLFWISMDTSKWHHSTVKSNEPYWKSVQATLRLWEVFFSLAPAVCSPLGSL